MERYVEKKRERRIRDFRRMVARAYVVAGRLWTAPRTQVYGNPLTWNEVSERRRRDARRLANNLRHCPCCRRSGNGRRLWGDRSLQECRQALAAIEQFIELRFLDDCEGQRNVRRRGPWI